MVGPVKFNSEVSVSNIILLLGFVGTMIVSIFGGWNRISDHEIRITAIEHRLEEINKSQSEYQTEMRGQVSHAVDMLTDVRLRLATMPSPNQQGTQGHAR